MGRHSHSRTLSLWMNGTYVGAWQLHPLYGDTLTYADSWISSTQGRPISLSLPFTPGNVPHKGLAVRAYFENLLPDSEHIRKRISRRFGTSTTHAFELLSHIGRDCAGALQVLPVGRAPAAMGELDAELLNEADVARILRETVAPSTFGNTSDGNNDLRISIAGTQEKTALLHIDNQWYRPKGATPTSHILKLPLGLVGNMKLDLSESVENEWLCATLLHAYGLPVADCRPLQFEDQKVLCVRRFDRRWAVGNPRTLIRLPQEDMCQATATPPHLKYENDGGPGMDTIMELLNGSANRDADKLTFFQSQVLFWMLGAPDGHGKNFSFHLLPGGRYTLTPLYDVLSAYPVLGDGPHQISPHKIKLAMAVRSKNPHYRMEDILRHHWVALGRRNGIVAPDGKDAAGVIDDLVSRTTEAIQQVHARLPHDFPMGLAEKIMCGLTAASRKLAD